MFLLNDDNLVCNFLVSFHEDNSSNLFFSNVKDMKYPLHPLFSTVIRMLLYHFISHEENFKLLKVSILSSTSDNLQTMQLDLHVALNSEKRGTDLVID